MYQAQSCETFPVDGPLVHPEYRRWVFIPRPASVMSFAGRVSLFSELRNVFCIADKLDPHRYRFGPQTRYGP